MAMINKLILVKKAHALPKKSRPFRFDKKMIKQRKKKAEKEQEPDRSKTWIKFLRLTYLSSVTMWERKQSPPLLGVTIVRRHTLSPLKSFLTTRRYERLYLLGNEAKHTVT